MISFMISFVISFMISFMVSFMISFMISFEGRPPASLRGLHACAHVDDPLERHAVVTHEQPEVSEGIAHLLPFKKRPC